MWKDMQMLENTYNKSLPIVPKEWPVNGFQAFFCCCVHTHIQLHQKVKCFSAVRYKGSLFISYLLIYFPAERRDIWPNWNTCVTGFSILILSGNWALVTRKVEIRLRCSSSTRLLISGYIIGSPTRDKAQCLGVRPSDNRSCVTPACTYGGEYMVSGISSKSPTSQFCAYNNNIQQIKF